MKKRLLFLIAVIICVSGYSQAPQALNYQAIARNADGSVIANQSVTVKFSVLENSANGTAIYQETHLATTNNFGLFTLSIGKGTATSGNFASINWGLRFEVPECGNRIEGKFFFSTGHHTIA